MRLVLISGILLSLYQGTLAAEPNSKRDGKLLSLFNIVTFPNDPCDADTRNGTCYTAEECSQKGGTNDGSCASGYGVCCTFTLGCGETSSENNTYFESGGSESGSCTVKICPCSDNICQLRLDFDTFTLTGPSTENAATECLSISGNCVEGDGTSASASQCRTDLFSVTNPGGLTPPAICGQNTGEHMYVDSNTACNDLNLLLGSSAVGTTLATRSWSIRVTQLECTSELLAPAGCTQYFFGEDSGTVKTYNYAGGNHLANQNQVQCIRREKGQCKICYAAVSATDFSVSGAAANQMFVIADCCNYGANGAGLGYDCVIIDGLSTSNGKPLSFEEFCGAGGLNTAAGAVANAAAQKTLCSKRQPFRIQFQSDNWEMIAGELGKTNPQVGYNLAYSQSSTGC